MSKENSKAFRKKLEQVMDSIEYMEKTGQNDAQNYSYLKESAVKDKFRQEFIRYGLLFKSNVTQIQSLDFDLKTKRGTKQVLTNVKMDCFITDAETGEQDSFTTGGQGIDPGDKGIYKAMTGAIKNGLMNQFLIPTGDDPEVPNDSDDNERAGQEDVRKKVENAIIKAETEAQLTKVMARAEKVLTKENLGIVTGYANKRFETIRSDKEPANNV